MNGVGETAVGTTAAAPLANVTGGPSVQLPTAFGFFTARAWTDEGTGVEHLSVTSPVRPESAPLVRLHSECLTGDVFASYRCDCGEQLEQALTLIAEHGGTVLYLRGQEGRGIGLANKVRAYSLQDRGLDTVEANQRLGFADDERDYGHAAAMLRALGISEVRLLTNNPRKVEGLQAAGIQVVDRVAHQMPTNPHNAEYLATKRKRSGHLFG
jgi:GTP cyclohydrolase II